MELSVTQLCYTKSRFSTKSTFLGWGQRSKINLFGKMERKVVRNMDIICATLGMRQSRPIMANDFEKIPDSITLPYKIFDQNYEKMAIFLKNN